MPTAVLAVTENTADSTVVWLQATPDWYAWFLGPREYTSTVSVDVLASAGLLTTELESDSATSNGIVLVLSEGNTFENTYDTTADGAYVTVVGSCEVMESATDTMSAVVVNRKPVTSSGGRRMTSQQLEWVSNTVFGPLEARRQRHRREELLLLAA